MHYDGIIFDLDGVIISTDVQHYLGWKALADRLGIPFNSEINNRFRGVGRMACMDILEQIGGKHYSWEEKKQYTEWKNNYYRKLLEKLTPKDLSNEVEQTLLALREKNVLLAVGSSSKNTKFILERIGLETFFDAVCDGTCVQKSKPDPEVFLKAAECLKLPPNRCLVVEDAGAGVDAAHAGGMLAAVVGDAAQKGYGDFILENFHDLLNLV